MKRTKEEYEQDKKSAASLQKYIPFAFANGHYSNVALMDKQLSKIQARIDEYESNSLS